MLETYAKVVVESPPSDDLPPGFDCTHIPSSSTVPKHQRSIYLRHGDTVHFEDCSCAVRVSVALASHSVNTSFADDDKLVALTDIQVKSSARQPVTTGRGAAPLGDDDENEDEDDLDGTINTPLGAGNSTPATSRPTDALAIKDTPSRPASRESNPVFSTAQEIGKHDSVDSSTPAARAGASRGKKVKATPSENADSQFVFPTAKGQTTYGGTPRSKRQAKDDILESHSKSDLPSEPLNEATITSRPRHSPDDEDRPITVSSPNRKRRISGSDEEDDGALPASTAPPTKKARGRGRPPKTPEALKPVPTKSGKKRGRPSKGSKAEDDQDEVVEPPSSTGKLKRPGRKSEAKRQSEERDEDEEPAGPQRRTIASPDLDPGASSTPQSSTPHLSGKAPTKVLLSKSKYAEDSKAKNWLKKRGATIDEKIPGKRSNFVCVVPVGELVATPKVLRSVALGKRVVTDQWLKDSMEQNQLLDLDGYVHDDLGPTMDVDRNKLLEGKALFVTSALEKVYGDGFTHIKELAAALGAHRVEVGPAKKASGMPDAATIFLGLDSDDPDAHTLAQEDGRAMYQKNLLTQSILRGELLLDNDEFKCNSKPGKGKKGKK
jgi:hypothetical protein